MKQRKVIVNAGAVIIKDEKVLLVQEANEPFKGKWNFPLGQVKSKEWIKETVIREVKEETGYDIKLTHFLGVYQGFSDPTLNVIVIIFRARIVGGKLSLDKKEILRSKWFLLQEINEISDDQLSYPEMRNTIKRALKDPRPLDNYVECF